DEKAAELIKIKPGLGIRDVRLERGLENCDLCGNSLFREGYSEFKPEHRAFAPPKLQQPSANGTPASGGDDMEALVKLITDQVMQAMHGDGQGNSVVKSGPYASGISGGV